MNINFNQPNKLGGCILTKTTIIIITFLLGWLPTFCQNVSVKASLDSTYILIGAQANLKLEVTQSAEQEVQFPMILDTITNGIEVVEISELDSVVLENDHLNFSRNYAITSFDSGYHIIPPFLFFAKNADGSTDTFATNSLALEVLLVPIDTSQAIKEIKAPVQMPLTLGDVLPSILLGLLVLGLSFVLFWYLFDKRKRKVAGIFYKPPVKPPHVIAFAALDKLQEEKLWQSGKIKEYHSKLTEIIRTYLEQRYNIQALERTSDEVLGTIKGAGLENQMPFEDLRQMLLLADLVKFAKGEPTPTDNNRSFEQAYDFVKKTLERQTEPPENQSSIVNRNS